MLFPQIGVESHARSKKPIDRWSTLAAVALSIMLYFFPKTLVFVIPLLILVFLALLYPIWNFWWIEDYLPRRIIAVLIVAALTCIIGFNVPLEPTQKTAGLRVPNKENPSTAVPLYADSGSNKGGSVSVASPFSTSPPALTSETKTPKATKQNKPNPAPAKQQPRPVIPNSPEAYGGMKAETGPTAKLSPYGQGMTAVQAFAIVDRLNSVFRGKKLIFVITAPKENERFRKDFYAMVVRACRASADTGCMIEPVPDPDVELDTGIPSAQYPGIVIHAPDSLPELTETMLKQALDQCFIIHKNKTIPDGIAKLNPSPGTELVWFELGPGSPWNPGGGCQAN
jgi:hypothetical protein